MSVDPEDEAEAAKVLKPVDDLLDEELTELKKAEEKMEASERKVNKIFPPSKRHDEE